MFNRVDKFGKYATQPTIGVVTHFVYDAKLKNELPYWDRFPLCIPADPKGNEGFLGWNLHYIPQKTRKVVLDELFKYMEFYKTDPRARLQASYGFMKKMAIFDTIKPCIKHYLFDHVRSRFLDINSVHFDKIIKLPTAQWMKAKPYQGAK